MCKSRRADIGQKGQTWPFTANLCFSGCIIYENINYKWETCRVRTEKQGEMEKCPKEERDRFESAPCYRAWLRAERWIPVIALGSDLQALLCQGRERSLSVSCCSQVCFLLAGGLYIRPPLHSPLTALRFVSNVSVSGRIFSLRSFSFNRCQDLNWSKYKDAFIPKLSLSQP